MLLCTFAAHVCREYRTNAIHVYMLVAEDPCVVLCSDEVKKQKGNCVVTCDMESAVRQRILKMEESDLLELEKNDGVEVLPLTLLECMPSILACYYF